MNTAEYDFELIYRLLDEIDIVTCLDDLHAKGCDDSIISIGTTGLLILNFTRVAKSAKEAIYSALEDVKKVVPNAKLIEVMPDYVELKDISKILDVSIPLTREMFAKSYSPIPIHIGTTTIWHLCDVLVWMEKEKEDVNVNFKQVASVTRELNSLLDIQRNADYKLLLEKKMEY